MDLHIGKEVWLRPTYNGAQIGYKTVKGVVTKIGRKYVDVTYGAQHTKTIKFNMADNYREKNDYQVMWVLYESDQEILDDIEHSELKVKCRSFFKDWNRKDLTTDQYRRILKIIDEA